VIAIIDIVAASLSNWVYAYARNQREPVWSYETRDHIRAICLKDINDDGKYEALIGSEDRNIHVLDHHGNLLWRYLFPHSVLCIDAVDIDRDKTCEIFVGCADGYLYVLDRRDDLIISGGENVYPAEVEGALLAHPAVREAGVIGVPDHEWGRSVAAVVVLHDGRTATEEELIAFCRAQLAGYKLPRRVEFRRSLPRNAGGKLLRRELHIER